MRRTLASALKASALAGGWYRRRLSGDTLPGVAVLCYHGVRAVEGSGAPMPFEQLHVRENELAEHCAVARDLCNPISLDDWRRALNGGPPLPSRPVLFTFDDGYRSVFTRALPVLETYGVPAVVFVCTMPVAERRTFWYDTLAAAQGERAVESAKRETAERWGELISAWSQPVDEDAETTPLLPSEVAALAANPLIEVASHGATHSILARLTVDQQHAEIECSIRQLEAWTGRPVHAFAYPNGVPGADYTPATAEIVRAAGIDTAFSTVAGFAPVSSWPVDGQRFMMLAGVSAAELAHRLTYSWRR